MTLWGRICLVGAGLGLYACLIPLIPTTPNWIAVATRIHQSVVRLDLGDPSLPYEGRGTCTAFSIHTKRQLYLTAAHCVQDAMWIEGVAASTVYLSPVLDLAVVSVPVLHHRALHHAYRDARVGEPVAALGYGRGFDIPGFRVGVVQIANIELPTLDIYGETHPAHLFFTTTTFIEGQSGSPIFNQDGRVVSIAQMSNYQEGIGRPLSVLLEALGALWEPDTF